MSILERLEHVNGELNQVTKELHSHGETAAYYTLVGMLLSTQQLIAGMSSTIQELGIESPASVRRDTEHEITQLEGDSDYDHG